MKLVPTGAGRFRKSAAEPVPRANAGQAVSWAAEYEQLSAADRLEPLAALDVERLATAAFMLGLAEEYFRPSRACL